MVLDVSYETLLLKIGSQTLSLDPIGSDWGVRKPTGSAAARELGVKGSVFW